MREQRLPADIVDGVAIKSVQEGGPAAKAGLKKGDIVVKANGRDITSVAGFRNLVAMVRPGKTVELDIYRDSKPTQIRITVEELTDEKLAAMSPSTQIDDLKITVEPLNESLAEELEITGLNSGAVVVAIDRRGKAAQFGLQPGDVITEINGKAVTNGEDIKAALEENSGRLLLKVRRGNSEMVMRLSQR